MSRYSRSNQGILDFPDEEGLACFVEFCRGSPTSRLCIVPVESTIGSQSVTCDCHEHNIGPSSNGQKLSSLPASLFTQIRNKLSDVCHGQNEFASLVGHF